MKNLMKIFLTTCLILLSSVFASNYVEASQRGNSTVDSKVANIIGGSWTISAKLDTNKNVHVDKRFENVVLWPKNGGNNERWKFQYIPAKNAYAIISLHNGKALAWDSTKGNNVFVYNYNSNTSDQHWLLEDVGNGYYIFKNFKDQNMVLDLYGGNTNNGTNIQVHKRNNGDNQKFKLADKVVINPPQQDMMIGSWVISSKLNLDKNLHVDRKTNNVVLWPRNGEKNERWKFRYVPTKNAYAIINLDTGKALAWNSTKGNNVFAYDYSQDIPDQHWILEEHDDGYYKLANYKNTNYVLDISGSNTNNGTNIQVALRTNGDNQKFKITNNTNQSIHLNRTVILKPASLAGPAIIHKMEFSKLGFQKYLYSDSFRHYNDTFMGYVSSYTSEDFTVLTGFFKINGKTYHSDETTGQSSMGFKNIDGVIYYFNEDINDPYLIQYSKK